jgi:hypothetical protein
MGRLCYPILPRPKRRGQHRAGSWYFSHKAVTVQGGYGALFAVMVQVLLSITCVAPKALTERSERQGYKFNRSHEFITGYKVGGGHWCSVAVQTDNGARKLSCNRSFVACKGAYHGLLIIEELSRKQDVQKP